MAFISGGKIELSSKTQISQSFRPSYHQWTSNVAKKNSSDLPLSKAPDFLVKLRQLWDEIPEAS